MKVKADQGSTVVVYAQEIARDESGLTPLNY